MEIIINTAFLSVLLGITSDAGSMTAGLTPSISTCKADIVCLEKMFNLINITNNGEN